MFVLLKQRARSSNTFRSTFRSIEGIVTHCLWLLQKSTQRVLPQERTNVQVDRANAIPAGKRGLARLFHADDTTTARARCCGPAAWRQAQKRCRLPCKAGAESLKTGYSSSNVASNCVTEGTRFLSGREFINLVKVRLNAVPVLSRLKRGRDVPISCRAGCSQDESLRHVLQRCHRTHHTRI